jgi:hypothetical protein
VICIGELRGALLAHSALGCPGVSTLLANLCSTIGDEHASLEQVRGATLLGFGGFEGVG